MATRTTPSATPPATVTTVKRSAGRPRDERVDAAIRAATIELLMAGGYNQLSIEAVARRAGASKRTIYRRWPSKAHLVHEAVFPDDDAGEMPPETGDLATDVRHIVAGTIRNFSRPEARSAIPGMMAEFRDDRGLQEILTERLERRARAGFRGLIERAVARKAVRPGVDSDVVFDMIAGTIVFAILVSRSDAPDGVVEPVVDLVLHAIAAGQTGA